MLPFSGIFGSAPWSGRTPEPHEVDDAVESSQNTIAAPSGLGKLGRKFEGRIVAISGPGIPIDAGGHPGPELDASGFVQRPDVRASLRIDDGDACRRACRHAGGCRRRRVRRRGRGGETRRVRMNAELRSLRRRSLRPEWAPFRGSAVAATPVIAHEQEEDDTPRCEELHVECP